MKPTKQIDGDVAVGGNIAVGGGAQIQGDARIGHNLKVEGWLDAKNLKNPCLGLFGELADLEAAYPRPRNGWWALVGVHDMPVPVVAAYNGKWERLLDDMGQPILGGNPTVDAKEFVDMKKIVNAALDEFIEQKRELVDELDVLSEEHRTLTDDIAEAKRSVASTNDKLERLGVKGAAGGIAPLDESGKVPSGMLPSYVDDVEMFDMIGEMPGGENVHFVERLPEDVAALPGYEDVDYSSSGACFLQGDGRVQYGDGVFYKAMMVYSGHSILDTYILTRWDGCERLGELTDRGVRPIGSMVYVCRFNNEQYRWSGEELIKLGHDAIVIGSGSYNAYSGADGKRLENRIMALEKESASVVEDRISSRLYSLGISLDVVNLSSSAEMEGEPYADLAEALDTGLWAIEDACANDRFSPFPQKGQKVTYLEADDDQGHWVTYRYRGTSCDSEEAYDPLFWELVTDEQTGAGGGDGTAVAECSGCKTNTQAILALRESLATTDAKADSAKTVATAASKKANELKTEITKAQSGATQALGDAAQAQAAVDAAVGRIEALEAREVGAAEEPWVTVSMDSEAQMASGWRANNTPSADYVFYPDEDAATKILVSAQMMAAGTCLMQLPAELSWDGKRLRIDDRRVAADSNKALSITPYIAGQKVYGSSSRTITLKGGYVELRGVSLYTGAGAATNRVDWVVEKLVEYK